MISQITISKNEAVSSAPDSTITLSPVNVVSLNSYTSGNLNMKQNPKLTKAEMKITEVVESKNGIPIEIYISNIPKTQSRILSDSSINITKSAILLKPNE